jgi:molybdate/tungstate transport system substrate-binding protein
MSTPPGRIAALALAAATALLPGCGSGRKTVRVFAADALAISFREIEHAFEEQHPDIDIRLDIKGSVLATRFAPLSRADVLAVADHRLVEKILSPKHATWVAKFASTEMVLAGHRSSSRRSELTAENWHEILLSPSISYGYANPSQDPCGYYARLSWELSERYYFASRDDRRPVARQLRDKCPDGNIARDALSLIAEHLNMARIDYAFVYRVHAIDQKLFHIRLPREINLGDLSLADHYGAVQITVPDYHGGTETLTGSPVAFGITALRGAPRPKEAQQFVRFVLSDEGQAILKRSGFEPIQPARVPAWGQCPEFLSGLAEPEE